MTHPAIIWSTVLIVLIIAGATLCACLLHLTRPMFKGETAWRRLRRSFGAKQEMGGNPRFRREE